MSCGCANVELSAEHFQKPYKDEVPEPRQLEGLQNLAMNHVPLRSTSNLRAKQTKPNQNFATSTQRLQDTVESAEAKENFTDFQQHVKTWNDTMALLLAQVAKPTPPTEVKTSSTAAETQPASVQSGESMAATPLPLADATQVNPAASSGKGLEEYEQEAFQKVAGQTTVQKKPPPRQAKVSAKVAKEKKVPQSPNRPRKKTRLLVASLAVSAVVATKTVATLAKQVARHG